VDDCIGRLLDELGRRSILDDTIVIITSDHGVEFEEYGVIQHVFGSYVGSIHVPLLIRFPRAVPRGLRIREPATLTDLATTALQLARVEYRSAIPKMVGPVLGS